MKIELKKIHYSEQLSEETHAFTANLYINGTHAGYAKNNGRGGATYYQAKDEKGKVLIKEAEKYCAELPAKNTEDKSLDDLSWDMDLAQIIDDLLYLYLEKKEIDRFNSKLNKRMLDGLVFGIQDQSFRGFVYPLPMIQLLAQPKGPEIVLKDLTEKVLPSLTDGNKLLNTNIPESIIKAAGLDEQQYVKPLVRNIRYGMIPYIEEKDNNRNRSR